jgi:hypothetical protein
MWIGYPKNVTRPLADTELHKWDGDVYRSALEDYESADPWINWNWLFWNSKLDTVQILSFAGADDTQLRPWYGYRVWVNTEGIEVIYAG